MIKLEIKEANKELEKLKKQLSNKKVVDAARMALNESARKGKTEVKNAITSVYNIKPGRITDPNRRKGLSIKKATNRNLTAEVDAGHIPTQLSDANPKFSGTTIAQKITFKDGKVKKGKSVKRSTSQISVEVEKGKRKTLATAFVPGRVSSGGTQSLTALLFARGKKGKPSFVFGKSRYPIDNLTSLSVATAATNVKAKEKYEPVVEAYMGVRFAHHIKRQVDKI